MNPSLRNLFMKKLTRERAVPTIPARVAWVILAMTVSGSPSLPKLASSRSTRASRFSLELNNWSTRSSSMRILRASRCCRNNSANTGSSWSTRIAATFSSRASELGDMVVQVAMRLTCPPRHPSPNPRLHPRHRRHRQLCSHHEDARRAGGFGGSEAGGEGGQIGMLERRGGVAEREPAVQGQIVFALGERSE